MFLSNLKMFKSRNISKKTINIQRERIFTLLLLKNLCDYSEKIAHYVSFFPTSSLVPTTENLLEIIYAQEK